MFSQATSMVELLHCCLSGTLGMLWLWNVELTGRLSFWFVQGRNVENLDRFSCYSPSVGLRTAALGVVECFHGTAGQILWNRNGLKTERRRTSMFRRWRNKKRSNKKGGQKEGGRGSGMIQVECRWKKVGKERAEIKEEQREDSRRVEWHERGKKNWRFKYQLPGSSLQLQLMQVRCWFFCLMQMDGWVDWASHLECGASTVNPTEINFEQHVFLIFSIWKDASEI